MARRAELISWNFTVRQSYSPIQREGPRPDLLLRLAMLGGRPRRASHSKQEGGEANGLNPRRMIDKNACGVHIYARRIDCARQWTKIEAGLFEPSSFTS